MDERTVPDILLRTPEFGGEGPKTREELYTRARQFLELGVASTPARDELSRIFERLYRHATTPGQLAALEAWLKTHCAESDVAAPWLALVQLARTREPQGLFEPLRKVDQALPTTHGRTHLVMQTEAARHLRRISSNPHASWARLAQLPTPDPALGEIATEHLALRLRLAAEEGAWARHHELASSAHQAWSRVNQPLPPLLRLILAEHELKRGRYAAALDELSLLQHSTAPDLRLAALQIRLHALIACADLRNPTDLEEEIDKTAGQLAPLVQRTWDSQETRVLPTEERAWRQHQARLLLKHAVLTPEPDLDETESERLMGLAELLTLAARDPERALLKCLVAIDQGSYRELPEIDLRLRLLRIRLTLQLQGPAMALTCEGLVNQVLSTAEALNLPILELLAYEQRAALRARHFENRWREVAADAAQAAYLATRVIAMNRGSLLEPALRQRLAPLFEGVVEFLVESALHTGGEVEAATQRNRYGCFVLDYIEQNLQLELEEARFSTWQDSHSHNLPLSPPQRATTGEEDCKTVAELRESLPGSHLVLQYFLLRRFTLIFIYGRDTFQWYAQPLPPEGKAGSARHWLRQQIRRLTREHGKERRDRLRNLGRQLLPGQIVQALQQEAIRHLTVVPDRILFRLPFRELLLQRHLLKRGTALSLQMSGQETVRRHTSEQPKPARRPRTLLALGPGVPTDAAGSVEELWKAFSEVETVTVDREDWRPFHRASEDVDLIAVTWGNETPRSLPELLHNQLDGCALVILPATWDLWSRVRGHPGLLLPQLLLDRGVTSVISSLGQLSARHQFLWLALLGRALEFLPLGAALELSQRTLSRFGPLLARRLPAVADATDAAADTPPSSGGGPYWSELRLTGNADLRFEAPTSKWIGYLGFYGWLLRAALRGIPEA